MDTKVEIRLLDANWEPAIIDLMEDTISTVNNRDYDAYQIDGWLMGVRNPERWALRWQQHRFFGAVIGEQLAGVCTLDSTGYIDLFYVHANWQGKGVARALMARVFTEAASKGLSRLWANVSITARPFFAANHFIVEAEQQVTVGNGAILTNYRMACTL